MDYVQCSMKYYLLLREYNKLLRKIETPLKLYM